ncbi:CpsB/CapC family capsule biosynthesis tyrosine phosphatase [Eubacteriaceae bacterium ES2]|nr:CpsB/CapC family capsule biosynthesis tyrosine phosphatase [Eubacteriaceae bacterium ES2]
MIDLHTHVLPGMDDGSKSVDESIQMMDNSFKQGVEILVATPHFYPWLEEPKSFLNRRDDAVNALPFPKAKFRVGAEIAYYDGMDHTEEIEKLKIEGTDLLLIEMPMALWTKRNLETLHSVERRTNLKLVIAHLDRYFKSQKGTDNINYACEHFLTQVNTDYFLNRWTQRKALNLVRENRIDFIGSDCHNLTSRPPNVTETYHLIINKMGCKSVSAFLDKQIKYFKEGSNYER